MFFFPQAVRWYVENYGGGEGLAKQTTWQSRLEFLREHPNQLKLCFQGLILTVCVPYVFYGLLEQLGFTIYWFGVALGVALGVAGGLWINVMFGVSFGITRGVTVSVAGGVAGSLVPGLVFGLVGLAFDLASDLALGLVPGLVFGLVLGVAFNVAVGLGGVVFEVVFGMTRGVAVSVAVSVGIGVVFGMTRGIEIGMTRGIGFGIGFGIGIGLVIWRLENWLIGIPLNSISIHNRSFLLPRITPIPLLLLTTRLKSWLRKDWQLGLENINQLLRYSLQFIPAINAINQVLAETPPEQMIYRISELAENSYDWELVKFVSASLGEELKLQFLTGLNISLFLKASSAPTRLDTSSRAIAAGFWHLHEKEPEEAIAAFEKVRSLLYGEEMFLLAQTLAKFRVAEYPIAIAEIQIPNFPPEPHLRHTTWETFKGLRRVVEDTQLIVKATSKSARAFALARAIGQLREILDNIDALPEAEWGLIVEISLTWLKALESIATNIGDISITKPVENPYVIGDPVEGDLFVGREDTMRKLEELWITNSHKQSVVLYGHRRMGKTSILRNVAKSSSVDTQVVYVNFQGLGAISQGMGEVFLAISDEISDAINLPPPDIDELLRLPERTFKLYLKQAIQKLDNKRLIIALDEFEEIEELIKADKLPSEFMKVLRRFVQMSPKIAFAFAGLHTLEEMTEDYFQPFFASVIPIRVGFLNRATTRQLLANPNPDFLLTYEPEAMDRIYDLTFGQPYLVQLLGFLLVRRYNEQTFEEGKPREPIFTVADVDAIIEQNELFQNGRYYFTGVWGQAGQDAPGQQDILKALANCSGSCSRAMLQELTGLDESTLNNDLDTLSRHDVIVETEENLKFAVELFRRWVVKNQCE
ncbi:MAG: ATP-binding protein [Cyanobacteria bacterium P01_H01_bin.35]